MNLPYFTWNLFEYVRVYPFICLCVRRDVNSGLVQMDSAVIKLDVSFENNAEFI